MHELVDLIAAVSLMMFVTAALVLVSLLLWVRAQRRRARERVERILDRLAEQVALRVAAGDAPGWTLERYARLTEDARRARTWAAQRRLVWRERLLDEAQAVLLSAPDRWDALRRARRGTRLGRPPTAVRCGAHPGRPQRPDSRDDLLRRIRAVRERTESPR